MPRGVLLPSVNDGRHEARQTLRYRRLHSPKDASIAPPNRLRMPALHSEAS